MPRVEPLENFNFRVKWDGRYVAGISKVSPLKRTTEVVVHRDGADPNITLRGPGRTTYEPIMLERGIANDLDFENWANAVLDPASGRGVADFRKDVILDLFNEAGQKVLSYLIHRCWVSEYLAVPELDADADVVAVERITLEHDGWERDTSVVWPP